jgi:hypothetical protein
MPRHRATRISASGSWSAGPREIENDLGFPDQFQEASAWRHLTLNQPDQVGVISFQKGKSPIEGAAIDRNGVALSRQPLSQGRSNEAAAND